MPTMLKQGCLTTDMSPPKTMKSCKTPNAMHVLSTPANFTKGTPPLNWDLSMIGDSTVNTYNENGELRTNINNESVKKSRRKEVPIKSKYMQSAAKRKTPAVGKTPSTVGQTPATNNRSNRQKIEELNRENTFTFESTELVKPAKPTTPKVLNTTPKTSTKPSTPKTGTRPTIKQSIGSERKALRMISKEVSATPKFTRKIVHSSNDWSVEEETSGGSLHNPPSLTCPSRSLEAKEPEVSEIDLQILHHQKLQMLYLLGKLETTQDVLSNEASCQMYQMWKVQENLRSDCSAMEVEVLVKEYICEVNDMCESLLPVCSELTNALPKFDKQFVTLCGMLDSTRHYINTVQIARLDEEQCKELQTAMKQVLELLKCIYFDAADDKENLQANAQELSLLKECFENSTQQYANAVKLAEQISLTNNENIFLTSTMQGVKGDPALQECQNLV